MRNWIYGTIFVIGLLVAIFPQEAMALANSLGRIKAWQVTCTGTAAKMSPADSLLGYQAFRFFNLTTTPVYTGGSDVNTTTAGYPVCTDSAVCADRALTVEAAPGGTFCRTGGSSVTVTVIGGAQ